MRGMMRLAIMGVPGAQGGGGISPLSIDFSALPDGALPSPLVGEAWSVSDGAAFATPTVSEEFLPNPTFEGVYSDGVAPGWGKTGTFTASEETSEVHGGGQAQRIITTGGSYQGVDSDNSTLTFDDSQLGRVGAWMYVVSAADSVQIARRLGLELRRFSTSVIGSWTHVHGALRNTDDGRIVSLLCQSLYASEFIVDDATVVRLIQPEDLFAAVHTGRSKNTIKACFTLASYEYAGIATRLDSEDNPQNGLVVYLDGHNVVVRKYTAGLFSADVGVNVSVTPVAGGALRVDDDGTTLKIYYNETLIRTETVADVPASSIVGLFSTHPDTRFLYAEVNAYGVLSEQTVYVGATRDITTLAELNAELAGNGRWTRVQFDDGTYAGETISPPRPNLTFLGGGNTIIDGEDARRAFDVQTQANITIRDLKCINALTSINFDASPNGVVQNVEVSGGAGGPYFRNGSDGARVSNVVCHDTGTGVTFYESDNCEASGCETYNFTERGFFAFDVQGGAFRDCYAHDGTDDTCYGFEAEQNCDDFEIEDCWSDTMSHGFIAKTSDGVIFRRNVAMNCAQFAFYAKGAPDGVVQNCVAYDSTIGVYLTDNAGVAPASTGWTLSDNILLDNDTAIRTDNGSDVGLASDYNALYGAGDAARIEGEIYATLALYQAGESQDAHSLAVDPAYEDVTYGGFLLPAESPLLTAGSDGGPMGREG